MKSKLPTKFSCLMEEQELCHHLLFFKFLSDVTHEAEVILWNKFFDAGVYITPGKAFHCIEPGWFRIVFAEEPSLLKLGEL